MRLAIFACTVLFFLMSCDLEIDYEPVVQNSSSPVVFVVDQTPYTALSSYQFFDGNLKDQIPVQGVLPYKPINTLFSDYSKKKRFIWLPPNSKMVYKSASEVFDFPLGSVIIKTFYYDNVLPELNQRLVETRLLILSSSGWQFANYVWNEDQTDAILDLNGSFTNIEWEEDGVVNEVNYRIPSESECLTCHKKAESSIPIGPKPMNLNSDLVYNYGNQNQLEYLVINNYLEDNLPENIPVVASYKDENLPLEDRVRGYLDINCAHCHSEESHCAYRDIRLDYFSTSEQDNLGVCVVQDTEINETLSHIVAPSNPLRSVLHYRMSVTDEEYRMPLLGRSVVHNEGLMLIEQWINSLDTICN